MTTLVSSLQEPFNYRAAIEGVLRPYFPQTWRTTYYFNPNRRRTPEYEAATIFGRICNNFQCSSREAQTFTNNIAEAIRYGRGTLVAHPNVEPCYLMGENLHGREYEHLAEFYGETLLKGQNLQRLARFYEGFVAWHEMAHAIERNEPGRRISATRRQAERLGDVFSILAALHKHGKTVLPLVELTIKGRIQQNEPFYDTTGAMKAAITFAEESGTRNLRKMSDGDLFETSQRLSFVN